MFCYVGWWVGVEWWRGEGKGECVCVDRSYILIVLALACLALATQAGIFCKNAGLQKSKPEGHASAGSQTHTNTP